MPTDVTVSAAYWMSGYDIQRDFGIYQGNGVNRLYQSAKAWQALHELKTTNPPHWLSGDLWTAFSDAARMMDATGI